MAGARPEYMPIVIAAVQAIGDPGFRLAVTGGSTHSFNTFFWVNGPLARQLGIEFGQGLIAAHANPAIGRTMSLFERNIAGFRTKETQMGTFGKLQSWVLAEDEEALKKIGWQPDHVARGFDKDVSTVSAASSTFMGPGIRPGRYYQAAALNDAAPTIAALLDIEAPSGSVGRILYEMFQTPQKPVVPAK